MKIRGYEARDFPALVALGGEMHTESDFAPFSFDLASLQALSDAVLRNGDLVCFVAEHDGRVIGMYVGGVSAFFFGADLYGFDFALYVQARFRGSSAAFRLVQAFLVWARSRGAKQLRLGQATGINPETTDRFFRKLSFRPGGTLYVYDL